MRERFFDQEFTYIPDLIPKKVNREETTPDSQVKKKVLTPNISSSVENAGITSHGIFINAD